MVEIYKLIDGKESVLQCTDIEMAEKMVKSNPDKYSFESRIKEASGYVRVELETENESLKDQLSKQVEEIEPEPETVIDEPETAEIPEKVEED